MPKVYRIKLSESQQVELDKASRRHPKPYIREKVVGIVKVAAGNSLRQVAYHQLQQRHAPETVKGWCESYLASGLKGLAVKPGRGRKAAFSPSGGDESERSC
jgi:hypothetical protein